MRIAVVGAGALGCFFGAGFAAGGAAVTYVARGPHLAALRDRGLTLVTPTGTTTTSVEATDEPAKIGPTDLVLFTVKSYDTDAAARGLGPLVGDRTVVLSLQNGVDNEARIAAVVGADHVLGGAAYITAAIEAPGVVRSGAGRIVVGELEPGPPSRRVVAIVEAARAGGIAAEAVADVRLAKWEKYAMLVGFSAVSAGTQLSWGEIRRSAAAVAMIEAVMREAVAVGRAHGVPLGDDLVTRQMAFVDGLPDADGASLRHDLLTGHRMELEALQGTLSRLGREAGVPTPWTDAAYAILQPWAIRNEERSTIP